MASGWGASDTPLPAAAMPRCVCFFVCLCACSFCHIECCLAVLCLLEAALNHNNSSLHNNRGAASGTRPGASAIGGRVQFDMAPSPALTPSWKSTSWSKAAGAPPKRGDIAERSPDLRPGEKECVCKEIITCCSHPCNARLPTLTTQSFAFVLHRG